MDEIYCLHRCIERSERDPSCCIHGMDSFIPPPEKASQPAWLTLTELTLICLTVITVCWILR